MLSHLKTREADSRRKISSLCGRLLIGGYAAGFMFYGSWKLLVKAKLCLKMPRCVSQAF